MPLVRIDMIEGRYASAQRAGIAAAVHEALRAIGVPEDDRFQIVAEHPPGGLVYGRSYLGIEHGDGLVVIQITLNSGRTTDQKKMLYRAIADGVAGAAGTRREDVLVNLVETARENWSFGNGEAQYAG